MTIRGSAALFTWSVLLEIIKELYSLKRRPDVAFKCISLLCLIGSLIKPY